MVRNRNRENRLALCHGNNKCICYTNRGGKNIYLVPVPFLLNSRVLLLLVQIPIAVSNLAMTSIISLKAGDREAHAWLCDLLWFKKKEIKEFFKSSSKNRLGLLLWKKKYRRMLSLKICVFMLRQLLPSMNQVRAFSPIQYY